MVARRAFAGNRPKMKCREIDEIEQLTRRSQLLPRDHPAAGLAKVEYGGGLGQLIEAATPSGVAGYHEGSESLAYAGLIDEFAR